MAYLSDDLITAIQRDSFLPTSQGVFTSPQLLAIADEQVLDTMVPLLLGLDSGWYREYTDTTLVADQAGYTFPRYAMFGKFFRVSLVDSSGNYSELTRVDPSMLGSMQLATSSKPAFFYVTNSQIVLAPAPDAGAVSTYSLRQWYYRRPGRLVLSTAAAVVLSVVTATGVVTYTAAPPAAFTSATSHDVYIGTAPFYRRQSGIVASALAGSTQTFPITTLPLAGDYVCSIDETVYPAIPLELVSHLKDLVIASLARSQMDREQYEIVKGRIVERARVAMSTAPGEQVVSQPRKFSLWDNGLLSSFGRGK